MKKEKRESERVIKSNRFGVNEKKNSEKKETIFSLHSRVPLLLLFSYLYRTEVIRLIYRCQDHEQRINKNHFFWNFILSK